MAEPQALRASEQLPEAVPQQLRDAPVLPEQHAALRPPEDVQSQGLLAVWSQLPVLRGERRCSLPDGVEARSCEEPAGLLVLAGPQQEPLQ